MNSHLGEESDEIEIEAVAIEVTSQPVELYKLLKVANLVSGGGEAKFLISDGYIAVNGELETRKRRKMYDGDFFEFNQEYYAVVLVEGEESADPSVAASTESKEFKQADSKQNKAEPSKKGKSGKNSQPKGRRNLDFLG